MISNRSLDTSGVACGEFLCHHGSICRDGPPNFDSHQLFDASFLNFHKQTTEEQEFHCECAPRYTGIDCSIPYQVCGISGHKCYFGGECFLGLENILGDDDLFCDCTRAIDSLGSRYVGKYCENLLVNTDDEEANAKSYPSGTDSSECQLGQSQDRYICHSDGICNPAYPATSKQPCSCPIGFTGPYCEYKESDVSGCTMPCQNGGTCTLGRPDPVTNEMAYHLYRQSSIDTPFMYCDCPEGYHGDLCQVPSIPCGDKLCLNDARCIEWGSKSSCSCSHSKGASFAGEYCQYKATTYCSQEASDHFESDDFFCTNGGHCREEAWLGCECPIGYHGFSCEYFTGGLNAGHGTVEGSAQKIVNEPYNSTPICDLDCYGRGTCVVGAKDLDYLGDAVHAQHLNETYSEYLQHCICQNGFTGVQCEHAVTLCGEKDDKGNKPHFCLHGSECVQNVGTGEFSCDCSTATSNLSQAFAGKYCEHPASSTCPAAGNGEAFFCVNQGECVTQGSRNGEICECPQGWEGRHCEIRVTRDEEISHGMESTARVLLVVAMLLLLVATAARIHYQYHQSEESNTDCNCLRTRRRRRRHSQFESFLSSTRPVSVMWPSSKWPSSKWPSSRELYFGQYPSGDSGPNLSPYKESTTLIDNDEYTEDDEYIYFSQPTAYVPVPSPKKACDEEADGPTIYLGPPRDEDGNELSEVHIT